MATYWTVDIDDIKEELVILEDSDVSATWDDIKIENALREAYNEAYSKLYSAFNVYYSEWDSACPVVIKRYLILYGCSVLVNRMMARNKDDDNYKILNDYYEKKIKQQGIGILNGSLYVNEKSDILAAVLSARSDPDEKYIGI